MILCVGFFDYNLRSQHIKEDGDVLKILSYFFYWKNYRMYFLLAIVLSADTSIVFLNTKLNSLYGVFFDALHEKNIELFYANLKPIILTTLLIVLVFMLSYYSGIVFLINWKKTVVHEFLKLYLQSCNAHTLNLFYPSIDNPDQRIASDIQDVLDKIFNLVTGLLKQVLSISAFTLVLWEISPYQKFVFWGKSFEIGGIFVWSAILYAGLGTVATILFGRKLSFLKRMKEKVNANFRFELMKTRSNATMITLSNGQDYLAKVLNSMFFEVIKNYYKILFVNLPISIINITYEIVKKFAVLIICSPFYLNDLMTFGNMMRIPGAFNNVNNGWSFIIYQYQNITSLIASAKRLVELHNALIESPKSYYNINNTQFNDRSEIIVENVSISTPDGVQLLQGVNIKCLSGTRTMIAGEVGIGKTTFVNTLMGLWPFYDGHINVSREIFVLTQEVQIFNGPLIENIIYPSSTYNQRDFGLIRQIFNDVKCVELIKKLEMVENWDNILSSGEKQIIAIIRCIYHKPKVIILDEPTSSLDSETSNMLFNYLLRKLSDSTIITISHDRFLDKFHDIVVDFKNYLPSRVPSKHI